MLASGWTRIPPGSRAYRETSDGFERIDSGVAVEALRKARATRSCDGQALDTCDFVRYPYIEHGWLDVVTPTEPNHERYASALLDGFSVDEITAAEEALA